MDRSMTTRDLVIELRAILLAEAPSRLHTERLTDADHPDEGGIGMPFTERFHRYLGHWSHWGQSRLGMLSIMEISEWCHARHTSHSIPGSDRSLCAQLVYEVCYLGQEPEDVVWVRGMDLEMATSMIHNALMHGREWRDRQERRPKEPRHDGPDPLPYERVVRSGLPRIESTA